MMSVWKMEWVDITFFFSRERRFVSSYFLLASLNNSLPLFYFILLMLSLFFFWCNHLFINKTSLLFSIAWSQANLVTKLTQ
jgi:hypothetical protein